MNSHANTCWGAQTHHILFLRRARFFVYFFQYLSIFMDFNSKIVCQNSRCRDGEDLFGDSTEKRYFRRFDWKWIDKWKLLCFVVVKRLLELRIQFRRFVRRATGLASLLMNEFVFFFLGINLKRGRLQMVIWTVVCKFKFARNERSRVQ